MTLIRESLIGKIVKLTGKTECFIFQQLMFRLDIGWIASGKRTLLMSESVVEITEGKGAQAGQIILVTREGDANITFEEIERLVSKNNLIKYII